MNVNDIVGELDKMLRRLLGVDIEYATHLAADLWDVRIDAGSFEQIVVNLAINARDAMPGGGRLTIETRNADVGGEYAAPGVARVPAGQYVIIAVSDTGHGMNEETRKKIFEPFFTTKGPGKGTGLGLATCYGIVEQAGGAIWVYSEPGHGTTFRVLLPREQAVESRGSQTTAVVSAARGSEGAVLLVEDDASVRKLAARVLHSCGYEVFEAENGAQALELVESGQAPVRLVLTDVVMPEMTGPQLAARLAELCPDVKVLFMSGYTRDAIEDEPNTAVLRKPFSPQSLAEKVRTALAVRA